MSAHDDAVVSWMKLLIADILLDVEMAPADRRAASASDRRR